MKPTPLKRKAPLKSTTRLRPRRKVSGPRFHKVPERDFAHMLRVKSLPCLVCRRLGLAQQGPTEAHHLKRDPVTGQVLGGGQKAPDRHTIPLCAWHHREGPPGVAFHAGRGKWEQAHGNEVDLLVETQGQLDATEAA